MPLGGFLSGAGGFLSSNANWLVPAATTAVGYLGARDQANQQQAQNAQLQQNYEWQRQIQRPAVEGAQGVLANQQQFQPFVQPAARQATAGQNIAEQYLANVPAHQQAGLQGLGQAQALLATTPQQAVDLGRFYESPYTQRIYDLQADEANRQAEADRKRSAISQGRFGALSGQAARQQGQIELARQRALNEAATNIGSRAFEYGQARGERELQRQQGLGQALLGAGATGLSHAQQASQLGTASRQAGVAAPFLPFQEYARTVSAAPAPSVPTYGTVTDPFSTAAGLGLQSYNLLNN